MAADLRMYEQFTGPERVTLTLEALARGDEAEADRLSGSCPRRAYTMRDVAFSDRMQVAFEIMTIACIDLRCLWGKLTALEWAIGGARLMATTHQICATFALLEGERMGRGLPQMDFFRRRQVLPETDGARDGDAVDVDDEDLPVEPAPRPEHVRFSDYRHGEIATRMMAVEDRMQATTDATFASLLPAALDIVRQLAEVWAAFDRFCRDRLGVPAQTLLDAWEFPTGREVTEVLGRYTAVKPDPANVDEYAAIYCRSWDQKFGEQR